MHVLRDHYIVPPTDTISDSVNHTFNARPTTSGLVAADASDCINIATSGTPVRMDVSESRLPLEIMEGIINIVDDNRALKACALSCSYFRQICQSRLFRNCRIDCDNNDKTFKEGGMVHTITHTDSHSTVMALIRWLRVENHYGTLGVRGEGKAKDHMLGMFLKKLAALEKLEFRGAGLEWRHRELVDGLITVLQLPSLGELKLASLERFPMTIILWGRSLKKVEFERVVFIQSATSGESEEPLVLPSLEELKMDNRGMGLSILRLHLLSSVLGQAAFAKLKKLQLEYRDSEGDRPDDINKLLSVCQSSLEDLVLFLTHDGVSQNLPQSTVTYNRV
ncbi:hypothetical protein D9756_007954 [Leucocoprinus leucothites]|uniref:F-box domain-containing protein n=1 Tax=Leucocoprinus leucothites TaxID=201217 RepID=A0A8H5FYI6_9AGAR|nr:hypothetical protein D9756_007954 [Leucoagaricus leucothites]